jgi:hypothetical protein
MKDTIMKQRGNCIFTKSLSFEVSGFDVKGVDSTMKSVSVRR